MQRKLLLNSVLIFGLAASTAALNERDDANDERGQRNYEQKYQKYNRENVVRGGVVCWLRGRRGRHRWQCCGGAGDNL
jgi:hypothetical protein